MFLAALRSASAAPPAGRRGSFLRLASQRGQAYASRIAFALGLLIGFVAGCGFWHWLQKPLPPPRNYDEYKPPLA